MDGWIRVKTILPEEGECVLVWLPDWKICLTAKCIKLKNGSVVWRKLITDEKINFEVTHWQELPDEPE